MREKIREIKSLIKKMIREIKLKGGAEVSVDLSVKAKCRSCGRKIWWAKTKNGKNMPICVDEDAGEFESHFASCKQADKWRKEKSK